MPYTFVEIEERKTRNLTLLFSYLVVLYVASIVIILWGVHAVFGLQSRLRAATILNVVGLALIVALIHWLISTRRLVDRVLVALLARPLDPEDTYHDRLKHIVEEVSVATGGRYRIEPYVMPTPAMNACAIADFSSRSAIIVTEGLLARLNREQLEAVVGHEAAHIASGDSLSNSVFCALFALHEEGLKRLSGVFDDSDVRLGPRAVLLLIGTMGVLWVTTAIKRFCELLISRQQEYRADAVAVRLTRDPLSLAEALQRISTHWRGIGASGESLSTIFILDPGEEYLSEHDGLLAELFSTHPPTERRIAALLGMAHIAPADFEQAMAHAGERPRRLIGEKLPDALPARWLLWLDGAWKGPFALEELGGLSNLMPDSWVRREGEISVKPASRDPAVLSLLQQRYGHDGPQEPGTVTECPNCRVSLRRILYEGVPLDECPACRGCYVSPDQMSRIFSREEYAFSDSIRRLAQTIPSVKNLDRVMRRYNALPANRIREWQCPKCGSAVVRKFYTQAYLVEVEQCWLCGLAWLDHDQLELLQYLYEEQQSDGGTDSRDPSANINRPV